jgi:antitoxin PrlF
MRAGGSATHERPMKATLKITSKGQVTLRRELLDELGVRPGDRIVVEPVAPGRVEIRRAERFGGLAAFVGCLKQAGGPALSLEDIRKVAREGWAGEQ